MSEQMNAFRETLVGILFFGALIIVGASTLYLGTLSLQEKAAFIVELPSAAGMRKGDLVQVDGVIMGRIEELDVLERIQQREVQGPRGEVRQISVSVAAEIELDKDIALQSDYYIQVVEVSALGGQAIEIVRGTSPEVAYESVDGARLVGFVQEGALEALSSLVRDNEQRIAETLEAIKNIVTRVDRGEGSLGKFISEEAFYEYLLAAAADISAVARNLNEGEGLITALVSDSDLRDRFVGIARNLDDLIGGISEGRGTIGKLFTDSAIHDEIYAAVLDVRSILARLEGGEGTFGMLLTDRDVAESVRSTIVGISDTVADLRKGESLVGRLLFDPELGEKLSLIVDDVATVVHRVSLGQGTIGRLLMKEDLGEKLALLLDIVTGAVEDAREAAPISTFANVVFSAF